MGVPTKRWQLLLSVLVALTIRAQETKAALDGEAANKQKNQPLVYDLHHKYQFLPTANDPDASALNLETLTQRDTRRASAIFPIRGNVYPDGLYYATLLIGEPPKPYFMDVDTGSELTWLQCDAPCVSCATGPHPHYRPNKGKLVSCKDPLCVSLHAIRRYKCETPQQQCDYEIKYGDRDSSLGVLVKDTFSFWLTNGSLLRTQIAFGCGYNQQGSLAESPSLIDGVLGLSSAKSTIVSQLKDQGIVRNVIGHCINGQGGGYLFFGDDLVPSSGMTWVPMSRSPSNKYYSPGPANLLLGKKPIGVKDLLVFIDSGASFTYFASQPYQAFVSKVREGLKGKPLRETKDTALSLCWKGSKPFKSILDVRNYFKTLTMDFKNSKKAHLEIPPEGYLIISSHGNVCLGILNGSEIGLEDLNVIGDISLQWHLIVYDNENHRIGWIPTDCKRFPNVDRGDGYDGGFGQPYVAQMGILKGEQFQCAANNLLPTDQCQKQTF